MKKKCFPEMLALINVVHAQAFAMRFDKVEKISKEVKLTPKDVKMEMDSKGRGPREWSPRKRPVYEIFDDFTSSGICDALLVVRPYVKIIEGVARLLNARLQMKVDFETIIDYSPLEKFWIAGDPKKYDPDDPIRVPKNTHIFISSAIDAHGQADPGLGYYGMILPNLSKVQMKIGGLELKQRVALEVGLVAATYTTREKGTSEQYGRAVGHGD